MINEMKLVEWMYEVQHALIFGHDDDYKGFPSHLVTEAVTPPKSDTAESVEQPLTGNKNKPSDITPNCNTCKLKKNGCYDVTFAVPCKEYTPA